MPQDFIITRCYSCQNFQVHQRRKDSKFTCKVCGLKQSTRKVYGQGTARDCRTAVQQLNLELHTISQEESVVESTCLNSMSIEDNDDPTKSTNTEPIFTKSKTSKWDKYLEETQSVPENSIYNPLNFEVARFNVMNSDQRSFTGNSYEEKVSVKNENVAAHKRFHDGEIKPKEIVMQNDTSNESTRTIALKKFGMLDDDFLDYANLSF